MRFDIEYNGGLGDIFNCIYQYGWHDLEDLTESDRATVWIISHNPFINELFLNHPKKHLITIQDISNATTW